MLVVRRMRGFVRTSIRVIVQTVRLLLILALVFLPLPMTAFIAFVAAGDRRDRREIPAEVVRKE